MPGINNDGSKATHTMNALGIFCTLTSA